MARINDHYLKLAGGYLFPEIGRRVRAFQERNPKADLIRLGIGDVVLPIGPSIRAAMHRAIDELGAEETFHGYGPEQGYDFLREAIVQHDFKARGVAVAPDEVFVSDGSKCDSGNIQEIFSSAAHVAVPDPVYPVYVDTNVMAGRTGPAAEDGSYPGITYLPCTEHNHFRPAPPEQPVDLVYLCFPNNPTGAAATRADLERWVAWAKQADAVLLYDAAYERYIRDPALPHSIYEIPGAREVAASIDYYMENARLIRAGMTAAGLRVFGAENAPYAWIATPDGVGSWGLFDRLLHEAHVVCTPGAGFGACGEGYLRLSAFGKRDRIEEAIARVKKTLTG